MRNGRCILLYNIGRDMDEEKSPSPVHGVEVHEHALKHGLAEGEVIHAWRNAFATATRIRDDGYLDVLSAGVAHNGN